MEFEGDGEVEFQPEAVQFRVGDEIITLYQESTKLVYVPEFPEMSHIEYKTDEGTFGIQVETELLDAMRNWGYTAYEMEMNDLLIDWYCKIESQKIDREWGS